MLNYYEILNLDNFCNDQEQIKQNYKSLITKFHPDHGGNANCFQQIKEAFEVLKDKDKKEQFDNQLIYQLETLERAETITISQNKQQYKCIQCEKILNIKTEELKKGSINIYTCEGCSMLYKIIIE